MAGTDPPRKYTASPYILTTSPARQLRKKCSCRCCEADARAATEIAISCDYIERAGGSRNWGYCYAYGSRDAIGEHAKLAIAGARCPFAFAATADDIVAPLSRVDRYALPRYNCNAFPHGAATVGAANRR